ncbi:MAG: hypothetical protein ABIH24_08080 [Verrucomicrobiota bacterium]
MKTLASLLVKGLSAILPISDLLGIMTRQDLNGTGLEPMDTGHCAVLYSNWLSAGR